MDEMELTSVSTLYNAHLVHMNCVGLDQTLIYLLHVSHYNIFSCAFRHTSAPSSGSLIINCSIFDATTGCTTLVQTRWLDSVFSMMQYFAKTLDKCLQPVAASKIKQLNMRLPEDGAEVSRNV